MVMVDLKSKWLLEDGPEGDIVISSRIRMARNLEEFTFPSVSSVDDAKNVIAILQDLIDKSNQAALNLKLVKMSELGPEERNIFVEKHLISPQQANNIDIGALIMNQDESLSIMVNEEDHLRIQSILPGLNLGRAWEYANYVDDVLEETLNYAYSEEQGYLTSCPTNVGTGLRASVMVHLPCLVMTNQISRVLSALSQLGLTVRGLYGEGTEVGGDIFQISNQITLGQSEEEIVTHLNSVIVEIINKEKLTRQKILKEKGPALEDKVFRALGILKYARVISSVEALNLLSSLRLGISLKIISDLSLATLKELMIFSRPAILKSQNSETSAAASLDVLRADVFRKVLNKI